MIRRVRKKEDNPQRYLTDSGDIRVMNQGNWFLIEPLSIRTSSVTPLPNVLQNTV